MNWISGYPYLLMSMSLLFTAALSLMLVPEHRKSLLLSGLLSVPSASSSYLFIPEYWDPKVVWHFVMSPEDILFSGAMGTSAWFLAIVPFAKRIETNVAHRAMLLRMAICFAIGTGSFGVVSLVTFVETTIMCRMLLAMLVVAAFLLLLRKDMVQVAIVGACGCTLYYGAFLALLLTLWPNAGEYWNPVAQLPFAVVGIPAFELLWALVFGFTWPLVISFALQARWKPSSVRSGDRRFVI